MGNHCCGQQSIQDKPKRILSSKIEESNRPTIKRKNISLKFLKKESDSQALFIKNTYEEENKAKFLDEEFAPRRESIIASDANHHLFTKVPQKLIEEYATYDWYRLCDIFENKEKLFITNPELRAEDIIQGSLGSCYLLCAISGLVKNNIEIYKNLFVIKEENKKGIYAVKFFIQGLPKVIIVDDFIPCKMVRNKIIPAFSYSRDKEASVLILEKAWAKINYKCYMKTWLGTPQEALGCLTEAPSVYEYHNRYSNRNHENIFWLKICEARFRNWILCANTENIKEEDIGLPAFHAYLILEVYEVLKEHHTYSNYATVLENIVQNRVEYERTPSNCLLLLKIRNPTGDTSNFKGEFNENSIKWTTELRRAVGNTKGAKSGAFFMTLSEYLKYFSWTFICKINDKYIYRAAMYRIEEGARLIEYNINKNPADIKDVADKKEKGDNSWNSDLLDNEMEEAMKKAVISKNLPINVKASILKPEQEFVNKKDKEYLNNLIVDNNFNVTPKNHRPSDFPGISQISSISPNSNVKRTEVTPANNVEDNIILKEMEKINYKFKSKNQFKLDDIIAVTIVISQKTKVYVTLHQPQHRFLYENILDYQVPLAFIIIAKFNSTNKTYKYINSEFINWEKLILDCYLGPGEYHIFAKSYWHFYPYEHDMVISTYADIPCEIFETKKEEISPDWIDKILIDLAKSSNKNYFYSKEEPTSFGSCIMPDYKNCTGFGIFYYENNSSKGEIVVNLNVTKSSGIKILSGSYLTSFNLIIPPKTSKHVLYQVTQLPWESVLKYEQEIWFEYPVDHIMKKYSNPEKLHKNEIETQLFLSEIKYERGYLIFLNNTSYTTYKLNFSFSKLKNYTVEKYVDHKNVEMRINGKSQGYLNIKCNKQEVDPNFKLVYKYTLSKV